MSNKTKLSFALSAAIAACPISHLTREGYEHTKTQFVTYLQSKGYMHVVSVADIGGKHIRGYILNRQKVDGLKVGSLQNEASHLRGILCVRGRAAVAFAPENSNRAMGIDGRSRVGTKTPIAVDQLEQFHQRCGRLGRPEMSALINLELFLGLRGNEALHARSDTLARWERELLLGGRIHVLAGTKGGFDRQVRVRRVDDALAAIRAAAALASRQSGFVLVRKGGLPSGGLRQARSIYHGFCTRSGIEPHSARYAFASDQLDGYLLQGYSQRESLILVSHDLGHGDGRGRWVRSVYTASKPSSGESPSCQALENQSLNSLERAPELWVGETSPVNGVFLGEPGK